MKKTILILIVFLTILTGCSSSEYFVREKLVFAEYYTRDLGRVGPNELPIELIYVNDPLAKIVKDQKGNISVSSPNAMIPKLLIDDSGLNVEILFLPALSGKVSEKNFESEKDFRRYFRTVWIGGVEYFILPCNNKRMFLVPVKDTRALFYRKKLYLTNSKIYLFTPKDEDPLFFQTILFKPGIKPPFNFMWSKKENGSTKLPANTIFL
jgi:hypothetical protein